MQKSKILIPYAVDEAAAGESQIAVGGSKE
jgi:hypothetical protein